MLKLLIADDERIIRETISSIIDWKSQDIEVVGLCRNGMEAYDMILDENPDIVLTDIRMPVMDGLELIRRVSEMKLGTQFIILSGYGEFDYARKAMQYGVKNYLLKPCNEEQILESVMRCRQDHDQAIQALSLRNQHFTLYREMFHGVISGIMNDCLNEASSPQELVTHYETYIDFDFTSYRLCYVYFLEETHLPIYLERLHSFLAESLPQAVVFEIYVTNTLLFFLPNPGNDTALLHHFLEANKQLGYKVSLEFEEVSYPSLASLLSVIVNKLQRFGMIYFIHGDQITKTRNYTGVMLQLNDIFQKIRLGDKEQLVPVQEILNDISDSEFLRQIASSFFLKMVANTSQLSTIELAKWLTQLDQEQDIHRLREMIMNRFMDFAAQTEQSSQLSPMIRQIYDYVAEHLQDSSLTLKQIAETDLFMNVDYVSKKFYKETGQKFSQYLTDVRIKKAQECLAQNPKEPIKNIAEQVGCGNNPQYFSQLFKKQTGITPTEYVAALQNN